MMQEFEISFIELDLSIREVYETMGYGKNTPDNAIRQQTEALINKASLIVRPRFSFLFSKGEARQDNLYVENTILNTGKTITHQLRNSELFVFFVATAGKEFEEWMGDLKLNDDILSVYIADSIGSCIAERTADYMEAVLEKEIKPHGWSHTNRYSPGYCGWHVSEQKKLFSFFPTPSPCGITLSDSCLMKPVKSVSGILGVGSRVKRHEYTCGLCTFENCFRRKNDK